MSNFEKVLAEIKAREEISLVVVGDRIEDRWHFVSPSRETEEGGPLLQLYESMDRLILDGGAANAWKSMRSFFPRLSFHSKEPPSTANRYVDSRSGMIIFRIDYTRSATPLMLKYDPVAYQAIVQANGVLLSDYGRGVLCPSSLHQFENCPALVFSPSRFLCQRITPEEVNALAHAVWITNEEEGQILRNRRCCPETWIETRRDLSVGARYGGQSSWIDYDVTPVKASHYCGIGDVFAAAFSAAYFCDVDCEQAIPFAIEVCRRVLQLGREGTHRILKDDVLLWRKGMASPTTNGKSSCS